VGVLVMVAHDDAAQDTVACARMQVSDDVQADYKRQAQELFEQLSDMQTYFEHALDAEKNAHELELRRLQTVCEETALEVDGIMGALDEKEAALEAKDSHVRMLLSEMQGLSAKASRLERLETNFSRAVYAALGLVEHVQALEAEFESILLNAQVT